MRNFKNIFLLLGLVAFFASCESDEVKYSGTPVGNQQLITVNAQVTTTVTAALTNQKIPFEIDLLGKTFADTVSVEATTLNLGGGRTRVSVDVMPGQSTATGEIPASGGAIFDSSMQLYLSAIALKKVEAGKHYLIKSNSITIATGSTSVPTDDNSKLQITFSWFNPSTTRNNLKVFVDRPNVNSYTSPVNSVTNIGSGINATATIFVNSTVGLQKGMAVVVSSGKGNFAGATTVTSVTPNSFNISRAPSLALDANAIVTAGGNDYNSQATGPNTGTTINVTSTAGLYPGMVLSVTGGAGSFAHGATVQSITNGTSFKSTAAATGLNATSVVTAAFSDSSDPNGSPVAHSISNNMAQISAGTSIQEGDYYFYLSPVNLLESGTDLRYRIVWKQPNGTADFYDGVYQAASLSSAPKSVLKVTKTGTGTSATYLVTPL